LQEGFDSPRARQLPGIRFRPVLPVGFPVAPQFVLSPTRPRLAGEDVFDGVPMDPIDVMSRENARLVYREAFGHSKPG